MLFAIPAALLCGLGAPVPVLEASVVLDLVMVIVWEVTVLFGAEVPVTKVVVEYPVVVVEVAVVVVVLEVSVVEVAVAVVVVVAVVSVVVVRAVTVESISN